MENRKGKEGSPEGKAGITVPLHAALTLHIRIPGNHAQEQGQDSESSESASGSVLQ